MILPLFSCKMRQTHVLMGLASLLGVLPLLQISAQLPRPRLGNAQRYKDHFHNDDGSTRYSFDLGGGGALITGATKHSITSGGVIASSAGLNFNRRIALAVRGEYGKFGVPAPVLSAYNQPDGNVQIISATMNVLARYHAGAHFLTYVTGGGGYYRRVTKFTTPTGNAICIGGPCITSGSSVVNAVYYSNTYGGNAGLGFEWKPSLFSNQKIFVEARYHFLAEQTPGLIGVLYPMNSRSAQYLPVLAGLRW